MKTNTIKILALTLVLFVAQSAMAESFTKTKSKTFDIKKGATLQLNTEFSDVKAHQWDKQQISIEATITVEATSESKANDRFERIKIDMSGTSSLVVLESKIESGFFNKGSNNISIEFLVYYPSSINLKADVQFGKVLFDNIDGTTDVETEYAGFIAQNLNNEVNEIEVSFGKFQASKINNADIKVDYGTCEIEEANNLHLRTSFSGNVEIEKVNTLSLKSAYDKVRIGNVNSLSGGAEFSGISIDQIQKSIEFKTAYGSFKLYNIAADFELIDIRSEFCPVKFSLDPASNFHFNVDVELGSFNYPKEKVTLTNFQKDVTDLVAEGYFGNKEKAKSNVRLSVEHASITLTLK